MRGHYLCMISVLSVLGLLLAPRHALGYIGSGPEVQLVPYFFSLLVWVGLALGAVLLWPIHALIRRLRGRSRSAAETTPEEAAPSAPNTSRRQTPPLAGRDARQTTPPP